MNTEKVKELREKIIKGLDLTYERLITASLKDDSDLVISRNGKVVRVKAKDIINKKWVNIFILTHFLSCKIYSLNIRLLQNHIMCATFDDAGGWN